MAEPMMGGQAVLEGVMMRSPHFYGVAVRNERGKIVTMTERLKARGPFARLPFIRGMVLLVDMMVIGIKALSWSAQQAGEEEEQLSDAQVGITVLVSLAISLALFLALPYFLTVLLGISEESAPLLFNLIDGAIKVGLLITYLWGISLMKEIHRVFQYHGAEHKVVFCYENRKPLTVRNVRKFSRFHPRCGTSFILMTMLLGVLLFSLVPLIFGSLFPSYLSWSLVPRKIALFLCRLLILPLIAAITYEGIRLSARHARNSLVRAIIAPGLWLQRITTKEPGAKQIEVGIKAMQIVLQKEKSM